jgi:hypothetical protein
MTKMRTIKVKENTISLSLGGLQRTGRKCIREQVGGLRDLRAWETTAAREKRIGGSFWAGFARASERKQVCTRSGLRKKKRKA